MSGYDEKQESSVLDVQPEDIDSHECTRTRQSMIIVAVGAILKI